MHIERISFPALHDITSYCSIQFILKGQKLHHCSYWRSDDFISVHVKRGDDFTSYWRVMTSLLFIVKGWTDHCSFWRGDDFITVHNEDVVTSSPLLLKGWSNLHKPKALVREDWSPFSMRNLIIVCTVSPSFFLFTYLLMIHLNLTVPN